MTGFQQTGFNLGAVVNLPVLILFNDNQRYGFYLLIGGKPLAANITLPSSSNRAIIVCGSGINNSCIVFTAIWTLHISPPRIITGHPVLLFINPLWFLVANIHQNNIRTDSYNIAESNIIFRCRTEAGKKPSRSRHNDCGKLSALTVKFQICHVAQPSAILTINDFLFLQLQKSHACHHIIPVSNL